MLFSPSSHYINITHSFSSPHHTFSQISQIMNSITTFLLAFLLTTASLSLATRTEPAGSSQAQPKPSKEKGHHQNKGGGGGNDGGSPGGFFGPGGGFNIPGFGSGWGNGVVGGGYGGGYGGPTGGYSKGGIIRPTIVCKDKGPCYKKKLICPAKCFTSYSRSGKNYGSGGGGGGCTMDCKKKCIAYC
ncbi:Nonribosomal peptide synthetase [Actinidia chinensis var. chinensis]|uniref:Nonribosomal peptide synthetase n=1 Tax=Actinidia chinensis var. chinensis TaxID=1590841 RepID=A0A2R6QLL3_ACTCC|nr:Nonribosomal peptide synthetase [Actinidia chinensis var. chinensis]